MPPAAVLERLPALADPTRVRLLHVIANQELTVGELCSVVQLPQSTVSRHLRHLSDDGWVRIRSEGTSRYYRLDRDLAEGPRQLWELVATDLSHIPQTRADLERLRAVVARRQARSAQFFASAAGEWAQLRERMFGERATLAGLMGLLDHTWVVGDLGCGTGHLTRKLAPFVGRVVGVDASAAMLEQARVATAGFPNIELKPGQLEALPLADASLDAAILALVLHNVADPAAALTEAGRVLRPGGRLLVIDMMPHARDELRQKFGHVWQGFAREQLFAWFEQARCTAVGHVPLPPDLDAEGPELFAASAVRRSQD